MIGLFGPSRIMSKDEVLSVCRENRVLLVDGKPVKQGITNFEIKCNVQPLTGLELDRVPELDRHTERFILYSTEISKAVQLNDRIVRNGFN